MIGFPVLRQSEEKFQERIFSCFMTNLIQISEESLPFSENLLLLGKQKKKQNKTKERPRDKMNLSQSLFRWKPKNAPSIENNANLLKFNDWK